MAHDGSNPSRETKFSGANERGQGNIRFPCSADHKQDWQPYSIDPYSCFMCDHTYILHSRINSGFLKYTKQIINSK